MRKTVFLVVFIFVILGIAFAGQSLAQTFSEEERAELTSDCQGLIDSSKEFNTILIEYIEVLIIRCDEFEKRIKLTCIKDKVKDIAKEIEKQNASLAIIKNLPPENANAKAALEKNFKRSITILFTNASIYVAAGYIFSPEEGLANKKMIEETMRIRIKGPIER